MEAPSTGITKPNQRSAVDNKGGADRDPGDSKNGIGNASISEEGHAASGTGEVSTAASTGGEVARLDSTWSQYTSSEFSAASSMHSSFSKNTTSTCSSHLRASSTLVRAPTLSTLTPQARQANDLSDLTIDKLKFQNLQGKLYGRGNEVAKMREKMDALLSDTATGNIKRQCILIEGHSGTGKSALAKSLQTMMPPNGVWVRGKFELQTASARPYSAFSQACAAICGALLERNDPQNQRRFETSLLNELGKDNVLLLLQLVPVLAEAISPDVVSSESRQATASKTQATDTNKERMHFAFLGFVKIILQQFTPLVIVLDDLQWADSSSLELLQVLLTSPVAAWDLSHDEKTDNSSNTTEGEPQSSMKLMVVGTYRSNEVDDTHVFHRTKDELIAKSRNVSVSKSPPIFDMTVISIGNLDEGAVHEVICDILALSHHGEHDDQSKQLARLCVQKTGGNVFFLLQFLAMLHQKNLLKFNFAALKWTWEQEAIAAGTGVSENVVDLLTTKMNTQLSSEAAMVLRFAAFLGSSFDLGTLRYVWDNKNTSGLESADNKDEMGDTPVQGTKIQSLENILGSFVSEGFLVNNQNQFSWAHDKIHEAAIGLVPPKERYQFERQLGELLLGVFELDLDPTSIFTVVNLLNGKVEDDDESAFFDLRFQQDDDDDFCTKLAELNLKAAQQAIAYSAFDSAGDYVSCGLRWLPQTNRWTTHYRLALSLHTLGAKVQGYLGNVLAMDDYCNAVISRDAPLSDKLDVYIARIDSLANRTKYSEAKDLCVDLLQKHKCTFPRRPIFVLLTVVSQMGGIKKAVNSPGAVSKLRPMEDETRIKLMKILDQFGLHCYLSKDSRMPLIFFKSLKWTFQYGYCAWSPTAIATTGVVFVGATGDLQQGYKCGCLALELLGKIGTDSTVARTYLTIYSFLFVWARPLKDILKPMLEAYDTGLRTGDTESGLWCVFHWIVIKMVLGSPLQALEADSRRYIAQMIELKREMAAEFLTYMRQVYLNLMGRDNLDNPTKMSGIALSKEALKQHRLHPFHSAGIQAYHGILLTYFGHHVQRAEELLESGHDYLEKVMVASIKIMFDTCYAGLSCFAAARKTGNKKYTKLGEILRSKIKKWVQEGNPNVQHYEALLDAESLAGKGRIVEAKQKFELAIWVSTRGGCQHDAALANERFGEFHMEVVKDKGDAAFYFQNAVKHWQEWGAVAKAEHLLEQYRGILPNPSGMVIVSS